MGKKGTDTIKQNRQDNENWRRAITYIEHYQMKYGQVNYSDISRQLNQNGYKTRKGCLFSPGIVRRLVINDIIDPLENDVKNQNLNYFDKAFNPYSFTAYSFIFSL